MRIWKSVEINSILSIYRVNGDIGRYYVIIRNIDGTHGDVYISFHGDILSSSDEQHLSKCENYPDHPFSSKHTVSNDTLSSNIEMNFYFLSIKDLFHVKAPEVGHIDSVSIHVDQTNKEHSLALDRLYIIHNAIVYQFDLKNHILNKEQPKRKFLSLSQPKLPVGKIAYYIATQAADRIRTSTHLKVAVVGTKGMLGEKILVYIEK